MMGQLTQSISGVAGSWSQRLEAGLQVRLSAAKCASHHAYVDEY